MIFALFLNFYTHSLPGLPVLLTVFDLVFVPIAALQMALTFPRIGVHKHSAKHHIYVIYFLLLIIFITLFPYIYFNSQLTFKNLEDCINLIYALIIFIVFASFFNKDEDHVRIAIKYWYYASILAAVCSIITILGIAPSHWRLGVRVSGSFKAINQLQSFVAPGLIFGIYFLAETKKTALKILHINFLLLLIVALLATGSRSSVLNILLALIFLNHLSITRFPKISIWFIVILLLEIVLFVFISSLVIMHINGSKIQIYELDLTIIFRIIDKLQEIGSDADLGPRGEQWAFVIKNFITYPLGIGHGSFQAIVGLKNEVHNTFLGILIENGLIVAVVFVIIYVVIPFRLLLGFKNERRYVLLLIYLHLELFAYQLTVYGFRQRIFWIEMALIYSAIFHLRNKNVANIK